MPVEDWHNLQWGRRRRDPSRGRRPSWRLCWSSMGMGSCFYPMTKIWLFIQKYIYLWTILMTNSQESCATAMAWSVDSTHAWAYALFKSPANMHGWRKIMHLLVRPGIVRGILCPSNALSVPCKPNNPSKFEKYATEVDWQCSCALCFLSELDLQIW